MPDKSTLPKYMKLLAKVIGQVSYGGMRRVGVASLRPPLLSTPRPIVWRRSGRTPGPLLHLLQPSFARAKVIAPALLGDRHIAMPPIPAPIDILPVQHLIAIST